MVVWQEAEQHSVKQQQKASLLSRMQHPMHANLRCLLMALCVCLCACPQHHHHHHLQLAHVALVPGDAFGAPQCLRISYAASLDTLREALDRVVAALAPSKITRK